MHYSKCKTNGIGRNRQPDGRPDHFFWARDPLQNPLIQRVQRRSALGRKVDVSYASRALRVSDRPRASSELSSLRLQQIVQA